MAAGPGRGACNADLPAGRRQQVLAPDHDIDPMLHIIHDDGELVSPLPEPVAHEQVAALGSWFLFLGTEPEVIESLDAWRHDDATCLRDGAVDAARAAASGIAHLFTEHVGHFLRDVSAGAVADKHQAGVIEPIEGGLVAGSIVALSLGKRTGTEGRGVADVGNQAKPVEVVEDGLLILRL